MQLIFCAGTTSSFALAEVEFGALGEPRAHTAKDEHWPPNTEPPNTESDKPSS